MRLKCPGSGVKMAESNRDWKATCPTCNVDFCLTRHGRLRAHSSYPKDQEIWERSKKGRRAREAREVAATR